MQTTDIQQNKGGGNAAFSTMSGKYLILQMSLQTFNEANVLKKLTTQRAIHLMCRQLHKPMELMDLWATQAA
jgi:hypothetical protein